MSPDELRAELIRLLTTDSESKDERRRDFNQAIFFPLGARHARSAQATGVILSVDAS